MPRGDGTGPRGRGPQTGRGRGQGGGGRGLGGEKAFGPGGECVCPKCGNKIPHQRGVPCTSVNCPSCGSPMTR